jgi:hypothetical protein
MKKILFFIDLVLICACKIDGPEISIKDIRFEGMTQGEIKVKVLVDINNPNNFSVSLRNIDFKMYFDNTIFGNGSWEGSEDLEPKSTKTVPITLVADKDIMLRVIASYFMGKPGDILPKFSIEGKAVVKKFWSDYAYNFKWKYKDKHKEKKDMKEKPKEEKKELKENKYPAKSYDKLEMDGF